MTTHREQSQKAWGSAERPTLDEINVGSLQRIADATEKMAASYDAVRVDRDYWKRTADERYQDWQRAERSIRSLRGVITKLKRRG